MTGKTVIPPREMEGKFEPVQMFEIKWIRILLAMPELMSLPLKYLTPPLNAAIGILMLAPILLLLTESKQRQILLWIGVSGV